MERFDPAIVESVFRECLAALAVEVGSFARAGVCWWEDFLILCGEVVENGERASSNGGGDRWRCWS